MLRPKHIITHTPKHKHKHELQQTNKKKKQNEHISSWQYLTQIFLFETILKEKDTKANIFNERKSNWGVKREGSEH